MDETILKEIEAIVGRGNLSTSIEDRICYSYDATNQRFLPEGVIFPGSAEEVASLVRLASRNSIPIVPRGAGSGFTGGSLPVRGGLVVSTERLNRILEVDRENLFCIVEPGVVTGDLQEEVESMGLFYPPDPSSLKFCTIGGNIAECAGGPRGLKYGVTRDYVLGLEVVLPDGEVIRTGGRTLKGVVGYDLTRLFVGSEGTLGFVTRAILKLLPYPEKVLTILALFPDQEGAAGAISAIISSGILPSALEFIDRECVACVSDYRDMGISGAEAILLIEVDGREGVVEREGALIEEVCREKGGFDIRKASDRRGRKRLWEARRAISPSLRRLNPHKINEDVVVPRTAIGDLVAGVREIGRRYGIKTACFGHGGDGNIHVNLMIDRRVPGEIERAEEAVKEVFQLTLRLGGTISGEHGIGITKAPFLKMELGRREIDLMRSIKETFDPKGIMNPGKVFPGD